jgi:glyoxylase-like metal-dependent hydrolase (beta-lactamase superfamily II)
VSCWLLQGDPLTLVDPGPRARATLRALEGGLAELGRCAEDIELLVLTHQHHDHVGLASELRERSGARVAGVAALAAYLGAYDHFMDRTTRSRCAPGAARRTPCSATRATAC